MYLKNKVRQHRRDFIGTYACNHCGYEFEAEGYDDAHFHHNVIPNMECPECGKSGGGPITDPTIPANIVI